jgi:hypothetical protein
MPIRVETTPERGIRLYLYSTARLILVLAGLVLLGTAAVLLLQRAWSMPDWTQYVALTAVIALAFIFSCYLAARPARLKVDDRGVTMEQKKGAKTVLWADIRKHAYYDELLLRSHKLALSSGETVSVVDFKWNDSAGLRSFLQGFESRLDASRHGVATHSAERSETLYESRNKIPIAVAVLAAYACLVAVLWTRDAFSSWNPVALYYFWVVPAAFFTKMIKAK